MKVIFRNQYAQRYFDHFDKDSDVYELGIDSNNKIYIAWLNGNVDRYTRREFIKEATLYYTEK